MGAGTSTDGELVTAVARTMFERIVVVEPEQASARRVFTPQAESFLADPAAALAGDKRGSSPLGFGLTGLEVLLVPVLMQAATDLVVYLTGRGLLRGAAASGSAVRRILGVRGDDSPPVAATGGESALEVDDDTGGAALTSQQWAEVRQIVEDALIRHARMEPDRAARLSVAVVGEGVLRGQSG